MHWRYIYAAGTLSTYEWMTFTKIFSSLNNRFSSHLTHKVYVNRGIELSLPYIHFSNYRLFGVKLPELNSDQSPNLLFIEHLMYLTKHSE